MKKLFTLCLSFIFGALAVSAHVDDVFQFTDGENGPVIPDGSRIVRNVVETSPAGNMIPGNLWLKNVGGVAGFLDIKANVKSISSNARFQVCYGTNCQATDGVAKELEILDIGAGKTFNENLMTEIIQFKPTPSEMSCEVVYQVFRTSLDGSETYTGSTITMFYTTDPGATGIDGVTAVDDNKEVARYTIDGQLLSAPQKGINIVKYADGTTKKVLVD